MQELLDTVVSLSTQYGLRILLALIVLFIGRYLIKFIVRLLDASALLLKTDSTVKSFTLSFSRIALNIILIIIAIGIIGIPMASVLTVLASAGVAIGLAMQGALSNFAGGIMLMIFRPFSVGNFIEASGVSGTVKAITLFYTVLETPDRKCITVPNGNLMNATITNFSVSEMRRVEQTFSVGKGEDPKKVQEIMLGVMRAHDAIPDDLYAPEPAFARLSGGTNESMTFIVRAWVKSADYWKVYFDLTESITEALGQNGISAPAVRVISK